MIDSQVQSLDDFLWQANSKYNIKEEEVVPQKDSISLNESAKPGFFKSLAKK
jgi:hypothetical protein